MKPTLYPHQRVIRSERKRLRLTQVKLQQRAGTSGGSVSRFETSNTTPEIGTLIRYLEALGAQLQIVTATGEAIVLSSTDYPAPTREDHGHHPLPGERGFRSV